MFTGYGENYDYYIVVANVQIFIIILYICISNF